MTTITYDILFLCEQEVEQCISYREAIMLVEEAWKKIATKQASQFRSKLLEVGEGLLAYQAGYTEGAQVAAFLIPVFFNNPEKYGLKSSSGLCVLFDPKTGMPVSVMSAHNFIKQVKTGCAAAVTAKYFAKKDSSKVAIIGAGYQAVGHFLAMKELYNLEEVRVFDISKEAKEHFAENMGKYGIKILPTNSIEEAMRGSDIAMTLTTANAPLVKKDWIEEGMLFLRLGTHQEMEPEVIMVADKVVVDWWDYVRTRSEEIALLLKQGLISQNDLDEKRLIYAELPEVVAGRRQGRENDAEKIVSIQLGMSADYVVLATHVYNRAVEAGMGVKFNLLSGVKGLKTIP